MNRRQFFLSVVLCSCLSILFSNAPVAAQTNNTIPPFKMLQSKGTYYSAKDLPHGKPVVLIYFAPDCPHCLTLMNALFKKIKDFKKAEIVMVTFKPIDELLPFEKQYQTYKYPNIKVGTEGTTFYLRYYYNLTNTPFTALYNKKGNMVYSYRKETPVDDLIK